MRQLFLILTPLLLLFASCEKEVIDNTDKKFPIEISVNNKGSLSELTWTRANVSSFVEYIIVRSTDSIPSGLPPASTPIVARIDDFEEITFVDSSTPFVEELYYKVYVDIGERFLESPSLKVDQKILGYDFFCREDYLQ